LAGFVTRGFFDRPGRRKSNIKNAMDEINISPTTFLLIGAGVSGMPANGDTWVGVARRSCGGVVAGN